MKTIVRIRIGVSLLVIILIMVLVFILPRVIKGYDFFNDKTCSPPCLANIIPGVTTDAEAFKIVSANKNFGSCNLIDQTKQGGTKYIHCQSYKSYIMIGFDKNLVAGIGIHPYPNISIKTIIEKFGYPDGVSCSFVNLPDYPQRVKLILRFDTYFTTVNLPEISGNRCILSADTNIDMVGYGSKDSYEESKRAAARLNDLQSWEGFTTYQGKDLP